MTPVDDRPLDIELRKLLDRQQIRDCVHRYARGVDRLDAELVLSAYHDDAVDSHGPFTGPPQDFVEWLWPRQSTVRATQTFLTNHTADIDGDTAHTETYWFVSRRTEGEAQLLLTGGRYVDRLERRDGEWRIAVRNVLVEWSTLTPLTAMPGGAAYFAGVRDTSDISYERPLQPAGLASSS